MIYLMEYIAFTAGVLLCWYMFRIFTDVLLTVLVFMPYCTKKRFDGIYGRFNDNTSYTMHGKQHIESYDEYLRMYELSKKTAYVSFRRYFSQPIKMILTRILPITLLPSILFWNNWYWYIAGLAGTLFAMAFYKLFVELKDAAFYQRAMVFTIFDTYINKQEK